MYERSCTSVRHDISLRKPFSVLSYVHVVRLTPTGPSGNSPSCWTYFVCKHISQTSLLTSVRKRLPNPSLSEANCSSKKHVDEKVTEVTEGYVTLSQPLSAYALGVNEGSAVVSCRVSSSPIVPLKA